MFVRNGLLCMCMCALGGVRDLNLERVRDLKLWEE